MEAFHELEFVTWVSRYRMGRELGRGFQGVVYLTQYQDAMSGLEAMKVFSPKPYGNATSYRQDMKRMSRVASVLQTSTTKIWLTLNDSLSIRGSS